MADTLTTITKLDRKSTRLNSSHLGISYAVVCLKKKNGHESAFRVMIGRERDVVEYLAPTGQQSPPVAEAQARPSDDYVTMTSSVLGDEVVSLQHAETSLRRVMCLPLNALSHAVAWRTPASVAGLTWCPSSRLFLSGACHPRWTTP